MWRVPGDAFFIKCANNVPVFATDGQPVNLPLEHKEFSARLALLILGVTEHATTGWVKPLWRVEQVLLLPEAPPQLLACLLTPTDEDADNDDDDAGSAYMPPVKRARKQALIAREGTKKTCLK